ncbi:MAG: DNA alkylation repair enzyme [Rikenellaceae bacterium]|nr:DNA alkylation repair enzyme [Rikenellaceae bacterium]
MLEQKKRLLLYRLRKEMNGAALDTMRYFGADYERNYGVQIYAIRRLAEEIGTDDEFARALYTQNIREMRLVALWIADAAAVMPTDFDFWAAGIINSEVAEQASHALFSRIDSIDTLLQRWCSEGDALCAYCALLAAARNANRTNEVARNAIIEALHRFDDNALIVRGASALAVQLGGEIVQYILDNAPENATSKALREEVEWLVG